ncbi:hypothetical protein [Formosa sediminum]|uniref:hypothetical protein n=1 Tax=Formosa sediminum TaxID=2594004 RepID=UPI00163D849B|nr:hypothetical protein [Formosa sediminum]
MMKHLYPFLCCVFLCLSFACERDDNTPNNDLLYGNYEGEFTVIYNDSTIYSNPVTLQLNTDNTYRSSGNENYFPAGGSGSFSSNSTILEYNDENFWTANFDWNLILNGSYKYTKTEDSLVFTAFKNNIGQYTYKLIKTE